MLIRHKAGVTGSLGLVTPAAGVGPPRQRWPLSLTSRSIAADGCGEPWRAAGVGHVPGSCRRKAADGAGTRRAGAAEHRSVASAATTSVLPRPIEERATDRA